MSDTTKPMTAEQERQLQAALLRHEAEEKNAREKESERLGGGGTYRLHLPQLTRPEADEPWI